MGNPVSYTVIYDGDCNLCSTLVQWVERLDRGQRFRYLPMQDPAGLAAYGVTAQDCERGMLLIDDRAPDRRWQGSDAAEEMARLLPGLAVLIRLPARIAIQGFETIMNTLLFSIHAGGLLKPIVVCRG